VIENILTFEDIELINNGLENIEEIMVKNFILEEVNESMKVAREKDFSSMEEAKDFCEEQADLRKDRFKEIEDKKKVIKEQIILLQAKLIKLKDKLNVEEITE